MRSRIMPLLLAIVMAVIGAMAAVALNRVQEIATELHQSNTDRVKIRDELTEQKQAATALAEQVKRLGETPVVDPTANPGPAGPGPSYAQVQAAVAEYCVDNRCKPTVTKTQVSQALVAYCAGGACQSKPAKDGKDGEDGTDGTDGADGTNGTPGPGPTEEQLDAAVQKYCLSNQCGKDGTNGTDGKDGVSVAEVECDRGTGSFTFTFSDGSAHTVECSPVG